MPLDHLKNRGASNRACVPTSNDISRSSFMRFSELKLQEQTARRLVDADLVGNDGLQNAHPSDIDKHTTLSKMWRALDPKLATLHVIYEATQDTCAMTSHSSITMDRN